MAQINKLQFTVQDNQGNPIPNCSVSVRVQGAFVTSTQAGPTYTVNDPGGITTSHTVSPGILGTPVTTVSSVTATTVVTGGSGLGTLVNNDRIVVETLPTLYADAQSAETKTNPLTTDASGKAFCWIEASRVDVIYTATGYATAIEYDRLCSGVETIISNIFDSATSFAFRKWTSRTLSTAGAMLERWENPKSTVKASLGYDGTLTLAGGLSVALTSTLTGNVTVGGTLGVTGATTLAALSATTGTFSSTLTAQNGFTVSGGTLTLVAGSVETADLAANAATKTYTADGTADNAITAGGAYADLTNATVSVTAFSTASEIVVIASIPGELAAGASATFFGAIRDSGGNVLYEDASIITASGGAGNPLPTHLLYRTTGSASYTFKLSAKCTSNNCRVNDSTNAAAKRVSRIIAMEFKK